MRPADKLQLKAATILPLVGLARSKPDPINRGHGAHIETVAQDENLRTQTGRGSMAWQSKVLLCNIKFC